MSTQVACGYEDANDCDALKSDPGFKAACGRLPLAGQDLSSQPTMSRFENQMSRSDLYRMACAFLDAFIASYKKPPRAIILDIDDTQDRVYGAQQLSLFNGYVGGYSYQPLHIYEGLSGKLITTILRPGVRPTGQQIVTILKRLVAHLRVAWPQVAIFLRGDAHFSSPKVQDFCAANDLYFILGQSANTRLTALAKPVMDQAESLYEQTGKPVRLFTSFYYQARTMETFCDDTDKDEEAEEATSAVSEVAKPDLITHMALGKMTIHDSKALLPAIKDTQARGVAPEHLLADTHYGSNQCIAYAKAKGVTLLAPSMPPKGKGQGKLTLEDFEVDACGHIQRCPAGHAPLEMSVSKKLLQVRFAIDVCDQCPLQEGCPIPNKERLQYTHERVKQRARRLSEQSATLSDQYRWRAGIEGTISRLKHQMGLAKLRVRGQSAVQYRVLLSALGLNIHRVAAWRGAFYPQKLFGRLLSALRCHQRVPGPYKPISGNTNRRFEVPTTRGYRCLSPLIARLFADPSTFEYTSFSIFHRSFIFCCVLWFFLLNSGCRPKFKIKHLVSSNLLISKNLLQPKTVRSIVIK